MGYEAHGKKHESDSDLVKYIDKLKNDIIALEKRVKKLEED